MRKQEDNGVKTYAPTLDSVLDGNARSITDELITPHPKINETMGAQHKVTHTRPGYSEAPQPTIARGRPVANNTRAPLAGGRFIQRVQGPGPKWLEPAPGKESGK